MRKETLSWGKAAILMSRNVAVNPYGPVCLKPQIDRAGRIDGNLRAFHLTLGRLPPTEILSM